MQKPFNRIVEINICCWLLQFKTKIHCFVFQNVCCIDCIEHSAFSFPSRYLIIWNNELQTRPIFLGISMVSFEIWIISIPFKVYHHCEFEVTTDDLLFIDPLNRHGIRQAKMYTPSFVINSLFPYWKLHSK